MLTAMVKYPKSSPHKKHESIWRKIAFWSGAVVLGAGLLAMAMALLMMAFNPKVGQRECDADFTVDRVEENPPGYPPADRIVAAAVVVIEKNVTSVPLTEATRVGVLKGSILHIRYTYLPRMRVVRIREWQLKAEPSAEDRPGTRAPAGP